MGLLDVIARNLAHVSDAKRNFITFRSAIEDPTVVLEEEIARRRRQRVGAVGGVAVGQGGHVATTDDFLSAALDQVVLDPTIRVRYTDKASLVEVAEEEEEDAGAFPQRHQRQPTSSHGGGGVGAGGLPSDLTPSKEGELRPAAPLTAEPRVVDVKEMFVATRRVKPNGVRFVGDREGWDRCLADMAEEQRVREMYGEEYVEEYRRSRQEALRAERRQQRLNASLRRRLDSVGSLSALNGSDGSAANFEVDQFFDSDEESGDEDMNGDDADLYSDASASDGQDEGGGGAAHFDSDDDDATSVYHALDQSVAYSNSRRHANNAANDGGQRRQAAGTSHASSSSSRPNHHHHNLHDVYYDKVRKLRAPRLEPRVFTHVHRAVGTDDMADLGAAAYEGGAMPFNFRRGGKKGSRTAEYSYSGASGAAFRRAERVNHPMAVAGRRAKLIFLTLSVAGFAFTALLWAYLSYLRYFLSGDKRFTTGGDYWRDGYPSQSFGVNATQSGDSGGGGYAIVNVTNDTSMVEVGGELYRVRPNAVDETIFSADSAVTLPMLGIAYIACVVAGIAFLILATLYFVCYVNHFAHQGMVADLVHMKQLSDELRAIDKYNDEVASNAAVAMGEGAAAAAGGGRGGGGGADTASPRQRARNSANYNRRWGIEDDSYQSGGGGGGGSSSNNTPSSDPLAMMHSMMMSMGMIPDTMPPSWEPEIPIDRQVEFNDSLDERVELKFGWLLPIVFFPIPLTDVLLADPSKERRKAMGLVKALFIPAWLLGLAPTIIFFIVAGDSMDTYYITVLARTMGGIDVGMAVALGAIAVFEVLPLYVVYHKKAGRFVESRYG